MKELGEHRERAIFPRDQGDGFDLGLEALSPHSLLSCFGAAAVGCMLVSLNRNSGCHTLMLVKPGLMLLQLRVTSGAAGAHSCWYHTS